MINLEKKIGFLIWDIDFGGGGETITKILSKFFLNNNNTCIISVCYSALKEHEGVCCYSVLNDKIIFSKQNILDIQNVLFWKIKSLNLDILIVQEAKLAYWIDFTLLRKPKSIVVQHFNPASFLDVFSNRSYYTSVETDSLKHILKKILYPVIYLNAFLFKRSSYRRRFCTSVSHSDYFIVLCNEAKEVAKKWLKTSEFKKVEVISNCVNLPSNPNILKDCKTVLFVGRVEKEKGANDLIKIWNKISRLHSDARLLIAGSIQDKNIEKQILRLRNVELIGYCSNMTSLYQYADVIFFLSYSEGLPMVLIEALAYGVIPISFDCPTGPKDLIRNNVNGYIINGRNIDLFVRIADQVLSASPIDKVNMRKQAIIDSSQFSITNIENRWAALFNKINLGDSL